MLQAGEVAVEDFAGELIIKSEHGPGQPRFNLDGPTLVEAGNGDISRDSLYDNREAADVAADARNGDVRLMLGAGWGAEFDVETRNGAIVSHPALDGSAPATDIMWVQPHDRNGPHRASGRFGLAGPLFRIVTLHGDVTLQQWSGQGTMPRWLGKP